MMSSQSRCRSSMTVYQHFAQLRSNPLSADNRNRGGLPLNRPQRIWVEMKLERRGKPSGPQHTEFIFRETLHRVANRPDGSLSEVVAPTDVVNHIIGQRIVKQSVHREVASQGIFAG